MLKHGVLLWGSAIKVQMVEIVLVIVNKGVDISADIEKLVDLASGNFYFVNHAAIATSYQTEIAFRFSSDAAVINFADIVVKQIPSIILSTIERV